MENSSLDARLPPRIRRRTLKGGVTCTSGSADVTRTRWGFGFMTDDPVLVSSIICVLSIFWILSTREPNISRKGPFDKAHSSEEPKRAGSQKLKFCGNFSFCQPS